MSPTSHSYSPSPEGADRQILEDFRSVVLRKSEADNVDRSGLELVAPAMLIVTGVLVLFSHRFEAQFGIGMTEAVAAIVAIGGGVAWGVSQVDKVRARREEERRTRRERTKKAVKVLIRQLVSLPEAGISLPQLQEELQRMRLDDPLVLAEALDELLDAKVLTVRGGLFVSADDVGRPKLEA